MSPGLRERKKLKTRAAIQKEAMRLFLEKGYEETTIEEIAEAVEISPSTFFNYFPSKEDVVFADDFDPVILAAFKAQPAGVSPITALRNAMWAVFSRLSPDQELVIRERLMVMSREPELKAALMSQFTELVDQIAALLAARTGRSASDFAVRNLSGAMLGVLMNVFVVAADHPKTNLVQLMDDAMAHLEAGLPLDWHARS